jgi:hypothetical protein
MQSYHQCKKVKKTLTKLYEKIEKREVKNRR